MQQHPDLLIQSHQGLLPAVLQNLQAMTRLPDILGLSRNHRSLQLSFPVSTEESDPHFSGGQYFPLPLFLPGYDALPHQMFFPLRLLLPDVLRRLHLKAHPVSDPIPLLQDHHSQPHEGYHTFLIFLFLASQDGFRSSRQVHGRYFRPSQTRQIRQIPTHLQEFPVACGCFHLHRLHLLHYKKT